MKTARSWQGLATRASVLALTLGALALMPGAAAASTHACGTHTIVIETETEPGKPKSKFKIPVKQIVTQGVSCASAFKFLTAFYNQTGGKTPEDYKCTNGKFKVPRGTVPEQCAKRGKKIQFAGQGG